MVEVIKLLKKYCTSRIDIKNDGSSDNNIVILRNTDSNSHIYQPKTNSENGATKVVESSAGILDLELKCITDGILHILLRSIDYRDINNNRFPIYIDYIDFKINNQKVFEKNQVVCFENYRIFKKNVKHDEIVKIHLEWLPFNKNSDYNSSEPCKNQIKENNFLKEKLLIKENQLKAIPQLSCLSLGRSTHDGKITYRNMLGLTPGRTIINDLDGFCERQWFTRYLKHKFPDEDYQIGVYGVSNTHDNLKYPSDEKKVLYSTEDLNYRFLEMKIHFDKYALNYVDLAMGYDLIDNPKYLRFPYWIYANFPPEATDEDIENIINSWNSSDYEKSKNVVTIASHDLWGVRTIIDNDINSLVDIDYAGKWKNNTSDLWDKFKNNKNKFLRQYKFNSCAENLISDGYITEKIFDAIQCDCIPLYAGGGNYLEPQVLNPKAIIRWYADDKNVTATTEIKKLAYKGHFAQCVGKWTVDDDRNKDSVELFKNLLTDEKTYNEFKEQDKLLDSSAKFVMNKFLKLEKHFERLIYG